MDPPGVVAEWIHVAHDLDTWPGAREAARRQMRRGGALRGRKPCSAAALADARDRDALLEMAAHGFQVRIAAAPLQGIVVIDRRTMILTDPAPSTPAATRPPTYTMSSSPALIGGACALLEAAWESAADLTAVLDPRRPRIDDRTAGVLRALGSGITDEAAARELGMSLRHLPPPGRGTARRPRRVLPLPGRGPRRGAGAEPRMTDSVLTAGPAA